MVCCESPQPHATVSQAIFQKGEEKKKKKKSISKTTRLPKIHLDFPAKSQQKKGVWLVWIHRGLKAVVPPALTPCACRWSGCVCFQHSPTRGFPGMRLYSRILTKDPLHHQIPNACTPLPVPSTVPAALPWDLAASLPPHPPHAPTAHSKQPPVASPPLARNGLS